MRIEIEKLKIIFGNLVVFQNSTEAVGCTKSQKIS